MDIFYEEMTAEQMEKCSGQGGLTKTVRMYGEEGQRRHGQFFSCGDKSMVPLTWIEHVASPLPRECSTTELQGHKKSALGELRRIIF